ncbi:MAG TPA: glycogen synthase [Phycisphaerae bacterium]|nr:glycogen synthase [Phycisphaerae bacterium]
MVKGEAETILFEISWEVCHKVGGIYRVVQSKVPTMAGRWGDRYCLIGPYHTESAAMEFEPLEPGEMLEPTLTALAKRGIRCHFGRWLIAGYPKVVLIELESSRYRLAEFWHLLWEDTQIEASRRDTEADDAVLFGYLVAELLTEHARLHPERRVVAHFHEWLASAGLPAVRARHLPVATVFTTHATLLGRHLCAARTDFYERLPRINPDVESGDRNIYHRYCLERAAAHSATVFSTVSDVTANEAGYLLQRKPDLVLPNGLRVERFAALHEFQNLHARYKGHIHQFVRGHFFGSYAFDLDKTLYFFFAGRYEYQNKGIDLLIEALYRLNGHLQHTGSDRTIVAFLIAPGAIKSVNVEVLNNHFLLDELRTVCNDIIGQVGPRMFEAAAAGELPDPEKLLTDQEIIRLKRMLLTRRRSTLPAIVTHDMEHDDGDPILSHLRHRRLFNAPEDRVKVVYHPAFLTATNPLFGLEYEDFVRGCHLGVFPSYYEPWGYTPAECTVMGVPSVTSNLSGFGAFIASQVPDHTRRGIYVLDRHSGPGPALDELTQIMIDFCSMTRRERIQQRNRTERLSELFDWANLGEHYHRAHELALSRTYDALVREP